MTEPPAHLNAPTESPPIAARPEPPADRRAGAGVPARVRCPRCGAAMGRLTADEPPRAPVSASPAAAPAPVSEAAHYCGCCGLVLPSVGACP